MHFTADSRFRRFLSSCIIALLTANGFAIALIATDNPLSEADQRVRTQTLVTTADGHRYLVDPDSEQGRKLIDDAKRNGGTIATVPAPTTSSTAFAARNPESALPTLPPVDGVLPIDPGSELNQTIDNILDTVTSVSSMVNDTQSSVTSLLDGTKATLTSVLNDTQSTIADVTSNVGGVLTTVSSTVNSLATTVSSTLGGVVTTILGTVSSLLPLPSPTNGSTSTGGGGTNPICLLAHC